MGRKTKPPEMPSIFGAPQEEPPPPPPPAPEAPPAPSDDRVDYDHWVPIRLAAASEAKLRCLITHADYWYWVKNESIMHDHTFDMLVREYTRRRPDDVEFLEKIGMWSSRE